MTYPAFNYRFRQSNKQEAPDPRRHRARIAREMFSGDVIAQQQASRDLFEADLNETKRHCRIGKITTKQGVCA